MINNTSIRDLFWFTFVSTATSTIITLLSFIFSIARTCIFVENEYKETTAPGAIRVVINRVCSDCLFSERRIVHDGRMIPAGYVICWWFGAIVDVKEEGGASSEESYDYTGILPEMDELDRGRLDSLRQG
jgi:hypothetical protein